MSRRPGVCTRLDWRLSPDWKLTNDLFVYDKFGEWKNAEVYTFAPVSGLLTRIDRRHHP